MPWTLRKQFWRRLLVNFIKKLMFSSSSSQTCYKKKHSSQKKYVRLKVYFAHEACSPVNPPEFFSHIPKKLRKQTFHEKIIKCSKVGCEQVKYSFDEPLGNFFTKTPENVIFRFIRKTTFSLNCCRQHVRYNFNGLWISFHRKFNFSAHESKKMEDSNKFPKTFSPRLQLDT